VSSQNLLARHGQKDFKKCFEHLLVICTAMPEHNNASQSIITFVATLGVTFYLLKFSRDVLKKTFEVLDEVFARKRIEKDKDKREKLIRIIKDMEEELKKNGVAEEEITKIMNRHTQMEEVLILF